MFDQVIAYASGNSSITDLRGWSDGQHPVGVVGSELSAPAKNLMIEYAQVGGRVFVDSGAYPAFIRKSTVDFDQVFAIYRDLVTACRRPENLALVGPDVIGDQDASASLQTSYLDEMQDLAQRGADIILPVQVGWTLERYAFHYRAIASRIPGITLGFAYNRCAWDAAALGKVVRTLGVSKIHLFGIGKRRLSATAAVLWGINPDLIISCDSNRTRAMVGKGRALSRAVSEGLSRIIESARGHYLRYFLQKHGLNPSEAELLHDLFQTDETELECDLYNAPGFLSPEEATALGKFMGSSEEELDLWACGSQQDGEQHGCKLGELLEGVDLSGRASLLLSAVVWPRNMAQERGQNSRSSIRYKALRKAAEQEIQERLPALQLAMGF